MARDLVTISQSFHCWVEDLGLEYVLSHLKIELLTISPTEIMGWHEVGRRMISPELIIKTHLTLKFVLFIWNLVFTLIKQRAAYTIKGGPDRIWATFLIFAKAPCAT